MNKTYEAPAATVPVTLNFAADLGSDARHGEIANTGDFDFTVVYALGVQTAGPLTLAAKTKQPFFAELTSLTITPSADGPASYRVVASNL